jgi:RNA polymerase sigma-70 factor (ECF subfamily)
MVTSLHIRMPGQTLQRTTNPPKQHGGILCPLAVDAGQIWLRDGVIPMPRTEARFDQLYRQHHRRVHAYCLRRTGAADADDAVAEVFEVAWRRLEDIPRGDQALPWLYGVARNVLRHQWRSASRFRKLSNRVIAFRESPPPNPEQVVVEAEEYVRVRRAVTQLRSSDREVLLLSAWEGLSHAEIATVLDCSTDAVDKRIQRAKQRLKGRFGSLPRSQTLRPPADTAKGGGL